jgi:hypothetical protein
MIHDTDRISSDTFISILQGYTRATCLLFDPEKSTDVIADIEGMVMVIAPMYGNLSKIMAYQRTPPPPMRIVPRDGGAIASFLGSLFTMLEPRQAEHALSIVTLPEYWETVRATVRALDGRSENDLVTAGLNALNVRSSIGQA